MALVNYVITKQSIYLFDQGLNNNIVYKLWKGFILYGHAIIMILQVFETLHSTVNRINLCFVFSEFREFFHMLLLV